MRGTGAARRREQEQDEPPDGAEAVAGLLKATAAVDAALSRMRRRDGDIARIVTALEELGATCGNAEQFAALAAKIADGQSAQVVESISCGAHAAEAREAAELAASVLGLRAAVYEAGIAEGERRAAERIAAERDARPRAPGAHRKRHLRVATSLAAGTAAAASLATGGVVAVTHDSASVHPYSASRPVARMSVAPPDSAVLVPSSPAFSSPRPSAAAASASPAPTVTPSAPVSSLPPPPAPTPPSAPAPVAPALSVPRFLDLGDSIRGELPLAAGADAVTWTATATDGITLSSYGGVLVPGQAVSLEVTDPAGGPGWIYVSFGGTTIPVEVTSDLGPVLS